MSNGVAEFVLATVSLAVFTVAAFAWWIPWVKGQP